MGLTCDPAGTPRTGPELPASREPHARTSLVPGARGASPETPPTGVRALSESSDWLSSRQATRGRKPGICLSVGMHGGGYSVPWRLGGSPATLPRAFLMKESEKLCVH